MRFRLLIAAAASTALFLVPAAGLAWEATRLAELAESAAASPAVGCPASSASGCPATAAVEMTRLALAAEQGCPVSAAQLLERAKLCPDSRTAALAARAAAGDDEAKAELIRLFKALGSLDPGPPDDSNVA